MRFEQVVQNCISRIRDEDIQIVLRMPDIQDALKNLPEYTAFIEVVNNRNFFYAGFQQSGKKQNSGGNEERFPTETDVMLHILEKIKTQYVEPRTDFEFVVESGGTVIGGAEVYYYQQIADLETGSLKTQVEHGEFILPSHQGKGYGKESTVAIMDFAFQRLQVDQVYAMVNPDNKRSLTNISMNTGAKKIGEGPSKYAHMTGGGTRRFFFTSDKVSFYEAVQKQGNQGFLIRK